MNGQTVGAAVTGTLAGTMTTNGVAQVFLWLWNGPVGPMPENVAMSLAAAALALGHIAYLGLMKLFGTRDANADLIPDALQNGGTKP